MKRRLRAAWFVLGAAVALTAARVGYAVEVFDDFSDLNDTANPVWTHLDGAAASTEQTWDASTGAYRLTAPNNSEHPILAGAGLVGAITGPLYTDVRVSADFISRPGVIERSGEWYGVTARMNGDNGQPAEGTGFPLRGYSYHYERGARAGAGEMVLNIFYGGIFKDIGSDPVTLFPGIDYRLSLEIVGNVLHGQTWQLNENGDPPVLVGEKFRDLDAQPVGLIDHDGDSGTDQVEFVPYESGFSGVFGAGHVLGSPPPGEAADFTIDNFRAESLSLVGDFNSDGVVDSSDLTQWQSDFGTNANSDADGDGDSDGNDFLLWQQNVGAAAPAGGVGAVPEPAAVGLALVAFGSLWSARRRRLVPRR